MKFTGGVPMVKIDGHRIRALREEKGVTQLFLATAVGVTTDTISRWENKRYPTIKRENGLKLAEALEVELEEILESEDEASGDNETAAGADDSVALPRSQNGDAGERLHSGKQTPRRPIPLLPFAVAALLALMVLGVFLWRGQPVEQQALRAQRRIPPHVVAGLPFPAAIRVSSGANNPISVIVKEKLPPGSVLLSTAPPASAYEPQAGEIKWLTRIDGSAVFAYTATVPAATNNLHFDGTVSVSRQTGSPVAIAGDSSIRVGVHHWADADGDGRISDEEILIVYDVFSAITGLDIDIDQVEEIWLGSGYEWDVELQKFTVLP